MKVHGEDAQRGDKSLVAQFATASRNKSYAMNVFDYDSKNEFRLGPISAR